MLLFHFGWENETLWNSEPYMMRKEARKSLFYCKPNAVDYLIWLALVTKVGYNVVDGNNNETTPETSTLCSPEFQFARSRLFKNAIIPIFFIGSQMRSTISIRSLVLQNALFSVVMWLVAKTTTQLPQINQLYVVHYFSLLAQVIF